MDLRTDEIVMQANNRIQARKFSSQYAEQERIILAILAHTGLWTVTELAKSFGVDRKTVWNVTKKYLPGDSRISKAVVVSCGEV